MHLALNYKGKPHIGIVLIPSKNELWIADGHKVWCERRKDKSIEKKMLNTNKSLNEMVIVTSKNHKNENLKKLIKKINFKKVIVMGSIGCKIASILRGECDIYISLSLPGESSPKDWDFAAPEAILNAAGELNYEKAGIIVATNNKQTHGRVCMHLKNIIKRYDIYPL